MQSGKRSGVPVLPFPLRSPYGPAAKPNIDFREIKRKRDAGGEKICYNRDVAVFWQ